MPSCSLTAPWKSTSARKKAMNMTKQMYASAVAPRYSPVLYLLQLPDSFTSSSLATTSLKPSSTRPHSSVKNASVKHIAHMKP